MDFVGSQDVSGIDDLCCTFYGFLILSVCELLDLVILESKLLQRFVCEISVIGTTTPQMMVWRFIMCPDFSGESLNVHVVLQLFCCPADP